MKTRYLRIEQIDGMPGDVFEEACAEVLRRNRYGKVRVIGASGDNGVDIIAVYNGEKYAIQCKRYHGRVGNHAVQEVFTGAAYYGCEKAVIMTNSHFTKQATDTARRLGVQLWDRSALCRMLYVAEGRRVPVGWLITLLTLASSAAVWFCLSVGGRIPL